MVSFKSLALGALALMSVSAYTPIKGKQIPPHSNFGGVSYQGGNIMNGNVNVYFIYYGSFTTTEKSLLTTFINALGASPWYSINFAYKDARGLAPGPNVKLAATTVDNHSLGTSITEDDIWTIVNNKLAANALPVDSNGVYFVLTDSKTSLPGGFCDQYCGWHTDNSYGSTDIKYSFVGNAGTICPSSCISSNGQTPNGDAGIDGMVSVIAHELSESVTDPDLDAWTGENADQCAWTFGTEKTAANGALYNIDLGGKKWLIQQNYVLTNVAAGDGKCKMHP